MHFPLFQISPQFPKKIDIPWKILPIPENFVRFSSAKISDDLFLVIDYNFLISPGFPCFTEFHPYFAKIIVLLLKIPPFFVKFTCFLHTLCVFLFSPYFDHDAFMNQAMHVLDAPANSNFITSLFEYYLVLQLHLL